MRRMRQSCERMNTKEKVNRNISLVPALKDLREMNGELTLRPSDDKAADESSQIRWLLHHKRRKVLRQLEGIP